jgi:hypothetical protein
VLSSIPASAIFAAQLGRASTHLQLIFASGEKINRRFLNSAMETALACTSASGVWSQRDSFQMLEMALLSG